MPLIYTFCIQMPFGLITIGVLCLELKYILSSNVHKGITSYRVGIYGLFAYRHIWTHFTRNKCWKSHDSLLLVLRGSWDSPVANRYLLLLKRVIQDGCIDSSGFRFEWCPVGLEQTLRKHYSWGTLAGVIHKEDTAPWNKWYKSFSH